MAPRISGISTVCSLWLAVLAAAALGCGTRTVGGDGPRSPSGGADSGESGVSGDDGADVAPAPAEQRVLHLALELEDLMNVRDPDAAQTRVTLVATDGTGSATRQVLGVFAGVCEETAVGAAEAGLPRPALVGADCGGKVRASRIRVVRDGDAVVALRAWIDDPEAEDAIPSYDEIERLEVEPGARLVTGNPRR